MAWKKTSEEARIKKSQKILTVILIISLVIIGIFSWNFYKNRETTQPSTTTNTTEDSLPTQQLEPDSVSEFDAVALQNVINSWVESVSGIASVVVADENGNILAVHNPEQVYFAASIYKLYVAYAGYQQIDSGEVDRNEIYVNGFTRYECLDKMIRESDSPCAEKLWNELGKAELTAQLETYGIENTSMEGITTTASDAGVILARIARGEGLSEESRDSYLSSMKDQEAIYRRGLPSGFENLVVYNKVGWNEQKEWHDTAIVELPDARQLIVSVFTENVGSTNIVKLGTAIESSLVN
jgi:beta-lactamase class A